MPVYVLHLSVIVLCCGILTVNGQHSISNCEDSESKPEENIVCKLRDNDQKLQKMNEAIVTISTAIERLEEKLNALLDRVIDIQQLTESQAREKHDPIIEKFDEKLNVLLDRVNKNQILIKSQAKATEEEIEKKLNAVLDHANKNLQPTEPEVYCQDNPVVCDCAAIKANGYTLSQVYLLHVVDQGKRYYSYAYCDMNTENGAWTVFQRRKDGSEDFYRTWNEYVNGFGDPTGEYWMGNEFLSLLTSTLNYRMRIDMGDFEGNTSYAEYATFSISSSATNYTLSLGEFSGPAGNCLIGHTGMQFSTKDVDNDKLSSGSCVLQCRGAWWHAGCANSNLNGLYKGGRYEYDENCTFCGIEWPCWTGGHYSLKMTEMKIRPIPYIQTVSDIEMA